MIKKILIYIFDFPKTIYFNYHYLGIGSIFKLPVLVSRKVKLLKVKGKLKIEKELSFGMLKIGFSDIGIFDKRYNRSIWDVSGEIIVKGNAIFRQGSKICVSTNGKLLVGENFSLTSSSTIVCFRNIVFGNNCLISWDVLIIDTDFHKIQFIDNKLSECTKEVIIGENVWIGCRVTILKGTLISDSLCYWSRQSIKQKILCP
jgi:acetyltransferase-like isoleucine patch superfamily enzyme